MRLMAKLSMVLILLLLASPLFLLKGCGNETSAPAGSIITINPSTKPWTSGSTIFGCPSSYINDSIFTITVADSKGVQLDGVTITIELDLSPDTADPSIQVLTMYDADTGLLVTSPYKTKTGVYGTKNIRVAVDLGCEYKATLSVFSGTAFGTASISVSAAS